MQYEAFIKNIIIYPETISFTQQLPTGNIGLQNVIWSKQYSKPNTTKAQLPSRSTRSPLDPLSKMRMEHR